MLSRAKKAVIYTILAIALWGGLAPRLTQCMPEAAMACCAHEVEQQCVMEEDCCRCESAPAHDLTIPGIVKPPRPVAVPVACTVGCRPACGQVVSIAIVPAAQSRCILKPPKLYLLNRSLLI